MLNLRMVGLLALLALNACGAASRTATSTARQEVVPPVVVADSAEPDPVPAPQRLWTNDAVRERLTSLPEPPVPWSSILVAVGQENMARLIDYQRSELPTDPIVMQCADGTTARVAGPSDYGAADTVRDAHALGHECRMTVGDLVACRLAVREHPCHMAGGTLPECEAMWQCMDHTAAAQTRNMEIEGRICMRGFL